MASDQTHRFPAKPTASISPCFAAYRLLACLLVAALCVAHPSLAQARTAHQDTPPTHTVQAGETLSEIAQAWGVPLDELMALNGIDDADAVRIGQTLRLPAISRDATPPPPAQAVPPASDPPASDQIVRLNQTVTVRAEDTLARIALRHGVDLSALLALNGLNEASDTIRAGQSLWLPATGDDLQVADPDRTHTVQPGESLGLIAQAYGLGLGDLLAANRIGDPDTIQPGQNLLIPGTPKEGVSATIGPARAGFLYHNVQSGDTMSQLSQTYNTTPQAIIRYNGLPDESTLYSGLEVRIPYGPPVLDRTHPPTPYTGTEFVISITRQHCWVMQNDTILYSWRCSTGQGEWATRTGTFPIKTKQALAQSNAYRLDMPFWLGLYDVGNYENGIHGLPVDWGTGEKLWDTLVGQPATFGCAMLLDEDAATLYNLAYLGMPVHIVD
ncbi:MAG: LysM peptidoglycan-binding domain-containing protein [Caldilineaceae bacterium]|nr:LysM peptidoglycan-binding domain-containing protein [Caldilineaceae bacterium]